MKCPLRFREFATDESHQECSRDCAWLMRIPKTGFKACAASVDAANARTRYGKWQIANYIVDDEREEGGDD